VLEDTSPAAPTITKRRNIKLIAVFVVLVFVSAAVLGTWYLFLRHWSIKDVAAAVINDPTPAAPGFKHSLAGKSVIVDGKVTNITETATSLGTLYTVELDNFGDMQLVQWGSTDAVVGKRISLKVSFEWSECNDERHVFSPQINFPDLMVLPPVDIVLRAVSHVNGQADLVPFTDPNADLKIVVDWILNPVPLSECNATLKAGRYSWAAEYIDLLGWYENNNITDQIPDLSLLNSTNGKIAFTDANVDRYLDTGDFFLIRNMTRPASESGLKTYLLSVDWPREPEAMYQERPVGALVYIIMKKDGFLRYLSAETPYIRMAESSTLNGVRFLMTRTDSVQDWDNVSVIISDGINWTEWRDISAANLTASSSPVTWTSAIEMAVGRTAARISVTDIESDGQMGLGDYVDVDFLDKNAAPTEYLEFRLMYRPMGSSMFSMHINISAVPICNTTLSLLGGSADLVFMSPHTGFNMTYYSYDLPWSEVNLTVSLSTGNISWRPSSSDLDSGSRTTFTFPSVPSGPYNITCSIIDLEGNGYLNRGDSMAVQVQGATDFPHPSEIILSHVPTSGTIYSIEIL
jgi:hypothetical protein